MDLLRGDDGPAERRRWTCSGRTDERWRWWSTQRHDERAWGGRAGRDGWRTRARAEGLSCSPLAAGGLTHTTLHPKGRTDMYDETDTTSTALPTRSQSYNGRGDLSLIHDPL